MKRFLTSTAVALALSTAAYAETHTMGIGTLTERDASMFYGSDLIGMRIYASEQEFNDDSRVAAGAEAEWDDIGEINDLLIGMDGEVQAVILGIGGFLGIGERDVAVGMDEIKIVRQENEANDPFLVVNTNKESLEAAPEFDTADRNLRQAEAEKIAAENAEAAQNNSNTEVASTQSVAESDAATETAATETETAATENETTEGDADSVKVTDGSPMLERPAVEREGYADVELAEVEKLAAEDIQGARVYGANDEDVGEVASLVVEGEKLSQAVIDVGGFLGMGDKQVAVSFDQLQIIRNENGSDMRVYMEATEEKLESLPEYQE